jgi:hypothetical protein
MTKLNPPLEAGERPPSDAVISKPHGIGATSSTYQRCHSTGR